MPQLERFTAGDIWTSQVTFQVTSTKEPIDPTVVVFVYSVGGATPIQSTYGIGTAITHLGAGTGIYSISTDTTGFATVLTGVVTVKFIWASSHSGQAIKQRAILVEPPFTIPTFP